MDADGGVALNSRLSHYAAAVSSFPTSSAFGVASSQLSGAGASTPPTSSSSASLVFTLPISCQICLSKVKDPVICANRHVFCKSCMDVWLQRNNQCPACRIQIDDENPLRTILGGLSVTDEVDDEDDEDGAIDAEKVKAARNSKKNLRKARIELLFNEYEEEIEDLREELKDAKEQNGRTADELRDVKEALATARKNADDGPPASSAPSSARDPHTTALLAELTAKLQEANDAYSKVLKDVDALKRENATLKEEKESIGFEVNRLRSRLQLRSPAKMGRYATVAMETEAASTRKEIERLKKALSHADANVEKMQREQEHLRKFHKSCRDDDCPVAASTDPEEQTSSNTSNYRDVTRRIADDTEETPNPRSQPLSSSNLSLPDSPSTTMGLLSLRSPCTSSAAPSSFRVAPPNASRCMRNLFATNPSSASKAGNVTSSSSNPSLGASSFNATHVPGRLPTVANAVTSSTATSIVTTIVPSSTAMTKSASRDDDEDDDTRSRFSLPSSSFAASDVETTPSKRRLKTREMDGNEEEDDVPWDVSLEPDVQDCLSLMRAAERKVLSRSAAASTADRAQVVGSLHPASAPHSTTTSTFTFNPTKPATARASTSSSTHHSRSSSAATDSTVISVAFSSGSSLASSCTPRGDVGAGSGVEEVRCLTARSNADHGSRADQRSLKREISQGELPSTKNFKH